MWGRDALQTNVNSTRWCFRCLFCSSEVKRRAAPRRHNHRRTWIMYKASYLSFPHREGGFKGFSLQLRNRKCNLHCKNDKPSSEHLSYFKSQCRISSFKKILYTWNPRKGNLFLDNLHFTLQKEEKSASGPCFFLLRAFFSLPKWKMSENNVHLHVMCLILSNWFYIFYYKRHFMARNETFWLFFSLSCVVPMLSRPSVHLLRSCSSATIRGRQVGSISAVKIRRAHSFQFLPVCV